MLQQIERLRRYKRIATMTFTMLQTTIHVPVPFLAQGDIFSNETNLHGLLEVAHMLIRVQCSSNKTKTKTKTGRKQDKNKNSCTQKRKISGRGKNCQNVFKCCSQADVQVEGS